MDEDKFADTKTLNFKLECRKIMKCSLWESADNETWRGTVTKREAKKYCKYCFRSWNDGFFTFKVRPKPVMGKRIRKLLRKEKEAPRKLTLFQKKLLKFVKLNQGNKLVLTCLNCRKSEAQPMAKRNIDNHEEEQSAPIVKKKKKKKDLFVGLNPEVVLKTALNKNTAVESANISFETSKKISKFAKTSNLASLNDQKNLKFQAFKPKSDIQQINVQNNKNVGNSNNQNNNLKSGCSSFFAKLEVEKRLEHDKKREMQKLVRTLKSNRDLREKVEGKGERKSGKRKGNKSSSEKKTDFKNFLKAFGNPLS